MTEFAILFLYFTLRKADMNNKNSGGLRAAFVSRSENLALTDVVALTDKDAL